MPALNSTPVKLHSFRMFGQNFSSRIATADIKRQGELPRMRPNTKNQREFLLKMGGNTNIFKSASLKLRKTENAHGVLHAKTGVAPASATASAVALNVNDGQITASPGHGTFLSSQDEHRLGPGRAPMAEMAR